MKYRMIPFNPCHTMTQSVIISGPIFPFSLNFVHNDKKMLKNYVRPKQHRIKELKVNCARVCLTELRGFLQRACRESLEGSAG